MLGEFISSSREALLAAIAPARSSCSPSAGESEGGVPLFLTQLSERLRVDTSATPLSPAAIGADAAKHARALLATGCSISQLVHDYADVGQAITELAAKQGAVITPEEFSTLNRCLDTAIVEAVTEYERLKEEAASEKDLRQRGAIAHDLRNFVQTALLSFQVLKAGNVASGKSVAVLGRSLVKIKDLADSIVSDADPASTADERKTG